jgi:hypothetical protein
MIENKPTAEKKTVGRNVAIILGVLCIALVASTVGIFTGQNSEVSRLTSSNAQLSTRNNQLQGEIVSLNTTIGSLQSTNAQLTSENNQLVSSNTQLNITDSQLSATNSQLSSQDSALTTSNGNLESQVSSLNSQVASLNASLPQYYQKGYVQGLKDGAETGYDIRDPSYQEVTAFMANDTVHDNVYSSNYTCWNFASDFATEAFNDGYRCGIVYMTFTDNTAHTIGCFNTPDRGLVFIEPQTDKIVQLAIGQLYQPSEYESFGTVTYYAIVW